MTARDLPRFGVIAVYTSRSSAERALAALRDSDRPPASLEVRDAASLGLGAANMAVEDEASTSGLLRALGIGALLGAALGAIVGLIIHAAMGSDSSVVGAEVIGVLVGLVVGAILGAFYGGAISLGRDRPARRAALVVGVEVEADSARFAERLGPTGPERILPIGTTDST